MNSIDSTLEAMLGVSGVSLSDVYAYAAANLPGETPETGRWENDVWVMPINEALTVAPAAK